MKVGQGRLLADQRAGQIKELSCRENGIGQGESRDVDSGYVIWRDDDFGFSEQLDLLGEMASGTGGGQIQDLAY